MAAAVDPSGERVSRTGRYVDRGRRRGGRAVKGVAIVLALLWAALNFGTSFFMITSAFLAKTPAKEGILAQMALLFGGLGVAVLSVALIWQCLRSVRA